MKDLELIGREKELKTLRDLTAAFLDERENKQALWLNVVGEDGIGKTRLLEELAAVIQSLAPSHLLTNRYSSGADFPCGSFTIALARQMEMSLWESEYTRKEKLESRFALFGRLQPGMPDILQIDKTLPVLGSLLGISYPVPVFNSQLRRGRGKLIIFSAFRRYLAALRHGRRGPDSPETVILWFDDLERMDRLSLELLVHLVQKKDTLWPLIVLTSSNCSFASKLSYLPEFNQFSLGPLSRLSRRKIIKALEAGSPGARLSSQVKQLLVEGSPGNPQLLRDAYRLLAECGPGRWEPAGSGLIGALEKKSRALETLELRDVIGQRLDRLDHRDCVILQSVALLGPYCSLEILSQMLSRLGYQFADLREKLEHLAREGFLHHGGANRENGRTLCCSCPLTARLVLESIPGERLTALHQQAAELLWESMEEDGQDFTFAAGLHLAGAYFLKEDWAVDVLTRCGDRFYRFEDYAQAAVMYDEAAARLGLKCAEQGTDQPLELAEAFNMLIIKAGAARLGDGRDKQAFASLSAALQIACSRELTTPIVECCLELGEIMVHRGDWTGAERFFDQGRRAAEAVGSGTLTAGCLNALGSVMIRMEDYTRAKKLLEQALELSREKQEDSGLRLDTLLSLGNICQRTGELEPASDLYSQALEAALGLDNETAAVAALSNLGRIRFEQGQVDLALDLFHQALERLRSFADIQQIGNWLGYIGSVYYSMEEFETSIDYYRQALSLVERSGQVRNQGIWLANLGNAYYEIKEVSLALEHYLLALELAREEQDYSYVCTLLSTIGVYYYNLREYERSWHYFGESLTIATEIGNLPIRVQNILYRGVILDARGEKEAAARTLDEGQALAAEHNMAEHQAVAQLFRGQTALAGNRAQDARKHCQQAARLAGDTGNRRLIVQIERALAACEKKLKKAKEPESEKPAAKKPATKKGVKKGKKPGG